MGNVAFTDIELKDPQVSYLYLFSVHSIGEVDLTHSLQGKSDFTYVLNGKAIDSKKIEDLEVGLHMLEVQTTEDCTLHQFLEVVAEDDDAEPNIENHKQFQVEDKSVLVGELLSSALEISQKHREVHFKLREIEEQGYHHLPVRLHQFWIRRKGRQ